MDTLTHARISYPADAARRAKRVSQWRLGVLALGPALTLLAASAFSGLLADGGSSHALLGAIALAWLPLPVSAPALLCQDELDVRRRQRRGAQSAAGRTVAGVWKLLLGAYLVGGALGAVTLVTLW